MKLILRTLLKSFSTQLLMEVILFAIDRMGKKEWVHNEDILNAIAANVGCSLTVENSINNNERDKILQAVGLLKGLKK